LGNVIILAIGAGKRTADRGKRKSLAARQKMEKRLFFNRIKMTGDCPAVNKRIQLSVNIFTHAANAPAILGN